MANFTTLTKNRLSWPSPVDETAANEYYLNIGSEQNLLISDTYKLVIQSAGRSDTVWTPRNKYT